MSGVLKTFKKVYDGSFPMTQNPISEGAHWLNGSVVGGGWKDVKTSGGMAMAAASQLNTDFGDAVAVRNDVWHANVTLVGTIFVNAANQGSNNGYELELLCRFVMAGGNTFGYEFNVNTKSVTGFYWGIVRHDGPVGTFTSIAGTASIGVTPTTGDQMKLICSGPTISAYYNNSLLGSATDFNYMSGPPGIGYDCYDIGSGAPPLTDAGFTRVTFTEN